jgi:acetoin utilization protein AcuB
MIPPDIKVQDCMTAPALTIPAKASLRDAGQVMKEYNIRHLPVVQDGKLVGILSSGDLRRANPSDAVSLSIWEINYLWDQLKVESAMTRHVITVKPETPVIEAVQLMLEHRFNSLPVVDDTGAPIGMLTEVDVFRLVIKAARDYVKLVAAL